MRGKETCLFPLSQDCFWQSPTSFIWRRHLVLRKQLLTPVCVNIYKHKGQIGRPFFFLLPHRRARLCSIWWFFADMRQVLDCMEPRELTFKMSRTFGAWLGKKCIFLFLETIKVPTTMKSYVHRDAPNLWCMTWSHVAHRPLDGTVLRCISLLLRCYLLLIFLLPLWNVVRAGYIWIYATDFVFPVAVILSCYTLKS